MRDIPNSIVVQEEKTQSSLVAFKEEGKGASNKFARSPAQYVSNCSGGEGP